MVWKPGTKFGSYEIVGSLGVGGMGEVYRARDTTLKRAVAIKVLPDAFAADPHRVARFKREAESLAALNHPNIAQIYGLESDGHTQAIVMELVEGQDLSRRLARGPLGIAEALGAARQIALALEAAHEHGIVHRDLKPANVRVTDAGAVKVLDFGLAYDAEARRAASHERPASLETVASPAITTVGTILGTPSYMAPEQVHGKPLDRRADLWAFGCVLYEMLTGRPLFRGDDAAGTVAKVLESQPDLAELPATTPLPIRRLLQRCLVKDVHERLGDAATARFEIDEALTPAAPSGEPRPSAASDPRWWRQPVPWLLAAAALVGGLTLGVIWKDTPVTPAVTRLEVTLPPGDWFSEETGDLAWSLDGRVLVYTAERNGVVYVFTRRIDQLEPTLIPATEGASVPLVFSDAAGEWIAFATPGPAARLKKVRLSGGPAEAIATAQTRINGIDVTRAGDLIFGQHTGGLLRVPARGGAPEAMTTAAPEVPHRYPVVLPDDDVLLTVGSVPVENHIAVLPRDGGPLHKLSDGTDARYLPTGHLVYWLAGSLWAAPFDRSRLVMGPALQVVPDVRVRGTGKAAFACARDGALAYVPARDVPRRSLTWVDRGGKETPLAVRPGPYLMPRLSPDDSKVLLAYRTPDTEDIWMADVTRGAAEPFMREPTSEWLAVWTADGEGVIFSSRRAGPFNLFRKRANGLGDIEPVGRERDMQPAGLSPAGNELLFFHDRSVWLLSLADGASHELWDDGMGLHDARFSPDGRWIAYSAGQPGQYNVWIRPYPDVLKDRRKIDAGRYPRWSADSRTLFYQRDSAMMSVTVREDGEFAPVRLFSGAYAPGYDVAKDGRFLMIKEPPQSPAAAADRIIVVLNWFQELRQRMR